MDKALGEMLIAAKVVTEAQLKEALDLQALNGGQLASILLKLGFAGERTLATALSRQQGIPFVVLSESVLLLETLRLVPPEMARKHALLPLRLEGQSLFVAMADPTDKPVLEEVQFVTAFQVVEYGVLDAALAATIDAAYGLLAQGKEIYWQGARFIGTLPEKSRGHLELVSTKPKFVVPPLPFAKDDPDLSAEELKGVVVPAGCAPAPKPAGQLTVMIVDDDESIRGMLVKYFGSQKYAIMEAGDGAQALALLQKQLPDVLVLDAMLPSVHGFEICRQVKHTPATRHIPVVMISAIYRGWGYATDVTQKYGADAFLEKPFSLRELSATVKKALEQRQAAACTSDELSARAEAAVNAAADAVANGDLRAAVTQLERAIEASPFSALLHRKVALLYDKLDEPYRAIVEMERAVQLAATRTNILQQAALLIKIGFAHKALEAFERCLKLTTDPQEAEAIKARMQALLSPEA